MKFFQDKIKLAILVYVIDAALGIAMIGGAALYGAAYASHDAWAVFFATFIPIAAIWGGFCFAGFKAFRGDKWFHRYIFWIHALCTVLIIPIGFVFAGAAIWLRVSREQTTMSK